MREKQTKKGKKGGGEKNEIPIDARGEALSITLSIQRGCEERVDKKSVRR